VIQLLQNPGRQRSGLAGFQIYLPCYRLGRSKPDRVRPAVSLPMAECTSQRQAPYKLRSSTIQRTAVPWCQPTKKGDPAATVTCGP
jgi:hypothetical protein